MDHKEFIRETIATFDNDCISDDDPYKIIAEELPAFVLTFEEPNEG